MKMKDFIEKLSTKEVPSKLVYLGRYLVIPKMCDYLEKIKSEKS